MSAVTDILTKIDTKISAILDDPDSIASYRLGDKQVSRSQILERLTELRKTYQGLAEKEPYEDIRHVALDFDEFGVDESEYIGDEVV